MTSSTVSSESVARQERRDLCGIDSYPATVSIKHVERQERRPVFFWNPEEQLLRRPTKNPNQTTIKNGETCVIPTYPEWLQEFRENLVDDSVNHLWSLRL